MRNIFLIQYVIVVGVYMPMSIIGMQQDTNKSLVDQSQLDKALRRISVLNHEDYKQVINAAVYFTLTNEPMKKISLKEAENDYPDFKFNEQAINNMFKVEMQQNEVKIVNVQAQSIAHQNKYNCWVPYEFILNDDEEIKIKINPDTAPINVKCDRSKKTCVRLLAALKIEAEHNTERNNFDKKIFDLRDSNYKEAEKTLFDALKKSDDIYNEERKQLREKHQKTLKSIEEELEKKELEIVKINDLLIQNQERIEALNGDKKQKEQFVTTKNSEIEGLKSIIEDLTKKKNEVDGAHSRLWDKYTQQEDECDRAVWHKKLFAAAFLACLVSLIGCVLKIQHVFV